MAKKEDYGDRFLYAENLLKDRKYHTVLLEIETVHPPNTLKTAAKEWIDKPTLKFIGKERMLVLNKTNQAVLKETIGDDDLSLAVGRKVILQVRRVGMADGTKGPAIRIMPPKGVELRPRVIKLLGTEAIWNGPPEEKPKSANKSDEPKKPLYAQVCEKIDGKTPAELQAEHGTILGFITKLNTDGSITDAEFADLGQRINTRLAEAETAEEPTEEGSTAD